MADTVERTSLLPPNYYTDTVFERNERLYNGVRHSLDFILPKFDGQLDVTVLGKPEDYPNPMVFCVTHTSWKDIPYANKTALAVGVDHAVYPYKAEFDTKWHLGKILRPLGGVALDRKNPDIEGFLSVMKTSYEAGISPIVFGPGTRTKGIHSIGDIKPGAAMAAIQNGAPIAPLAILINGSGAVVSVLGQPIKPPQIEADATIFRLKKLGLKMTGKQLMPALQKCLDFAHERRAFLANKSR